jgi:signal transduction histidine kinase
LGPATEHPIIPKAGELVRPEASSGSVARSALPTVSREALEQAVEADRNEVVAARLGLAAHLVLWASLAFVAADLFGVVPAPGSLFFLQGLLVVISAVFVLGRSQDWVRDNILTLATVFSVLVCAAIGTQGLLRGNASGTVLLFGVYVIGTSALIPWGMATQAITVVAAAVCLGGALFSIGVAPLEVFDLPMTLAFSLAMFDSIFVSYQLATSRRESISENLKLRASQAVLLESENRVRSLNTELEARVLSRTAELNDAVGEMRSFTSAVSHDLRQPLRSVNGLLAMLEEDAADQLKEQHIDYIQRSRKSVVRMGNMIEDLLALSRLRAVKLERKAVDLTKLAQRIAAELEENEPGRKVEFKIASNLSATADPGLMSLVLQNLLNNAWKFTRRQDCAEIEVGLESAEDQELAFYVKDNGIGFDMENATRLFGTFERLWSSDEFEGTGIGLATVERIVRRHDGRIWAEGAPGEGAVFRFTLGPAAAAALH